MKILKLTLENIKGITGIKTYEFNGSNVVISGRNEVGKSTIADLIAWLLTGKDLSNRANYDIKNRHLPVDAITSAEMLILENDGVTETVLKRSLVPQYKGKGTNKAYNSDATECFIDTLPKTVTDFASYINQTLFNNTTLDACLIIDLKHFMERLKGEEQRIILVNLFSSLTDEQFVINNPNFEDIAKAKGKHSIETFKDIQNKRRLAINKQLDDIPTKITENTKGIIVCDKSDASIATEIDLFKTEKQTFESQLSAIKNDTQKITLENDKQKNVNELAQLEIANSQFITVEKEKANDGTDAEMDLLKERMTQFAASKAKKENEVVINKTNIENYKNTNNSLVKEWHSTNEKQWEGSGICPTCEQALPEESVLSVKEKFNLDKSTTLEEINKKCTELVAKISSLEENNKNLTIEIENIQLTGETLKADYMDLKSKKVDFVPKNQPNYEAEKAQKEKALEEIGVQLTNLQNGNQEEIAKLTLKIANCDKELEVSIGNLNTLKNNERIGKRIEKITEEQAILSNELDIVSSYLSQCNDYIIARANAMTEEINRYFNIVKWQLFDIYKTTGEVKPNTLCTINNVPYGSTNTGSRYLAQLDINNAIQRKLGLNLPIVFDNFESFSTDVAVSNQMIAMEVVKWQSTLEVDTLESYGAKFIERFEEYILENKSGNRSSITRRVDFFENLSEKNSKNADEQ